MFAKTIIDSDAFLEMPLSTQALYFHLSMRADDDGFVNNPVKIQRMIRATEEDLTELITKRFILPFESGIVVIKHWRIHNYIRNDRYKPTIYQKEMDMLEIKENRAYTEKINVGIPNGYQMDTQYSIDKSRLDKSRVVVKEAATAPEADENLSEAVKAYESNIGTISEKAANDIAEWLEKGADISLIVFAIEQAAEYNARNWKYADTIINNHFKAGRKTRKAAETYGKTLKNNNSSVKKSSAKDSYEPDDMAAAERKARLEKMRKAE